MFSMFDQLFGRSSNWRTVRAEHIKKHPKCAACGRKDGLEVHHIVPYHVDPSRELDPENLITLCGKYCHFVFGHLMDWKSWNENVVEDAIEYNIAKNKRPYSMVFGEPQKRWYHAIFSNVIMHLRRLI